MAARSSLFSAMVSLPFNGIVCLLVLAACGAKRAHADGETPQVRAAIQRGAAYIRSKSVPTSGGYSGLDAYALIKAGDPPGSPAVAAILADIRKKVTSRGYAPRNHHVYEAGVDLLALEAADPQGFVAEIQAIAQYLITEQRSHGGWFYPGQQDTGGDTSITQYALLGLWAARRAGFEVPEQVWDRAARWHMSNQQPDGSFLYHPARRDEAPTNTMTAAAIGSLHICRLHLFASAGPAPAAAPSVNPNRRKFGVLEAVAVPATAVEEQPAYEVKATREAVDRSIERGLNWITAWHRKFGVETKRWQNYYLYGLERMAALAGLEKIDGRDWYAEGSEFLLKQQQPDGSWTYPNFTDAAGTSFAVLFLLRPTSKLIKPPVTKERVGSGLLAGGRGLPENLGEVNIQDGRVEKRKLAGQIDDLLANLENPAATELAAAQQAIVETVQLDQPDELIAQKDRLVRLVKDARVDVRRTAVWALARTGDLRIAPLMIAALEDADIGVAIEAHNGLCVLSRKPKGLGLPPAPEVSEGAGEDEAWQAEGRWRAKAKKRWHEWYLRIRPYDERDDLIQLERATAESRR